MSGVTTISPAKLAEQNRGGAVELIDVRTPVEFREVHASMARNVPLDRLVADDVMKQRTGGQDQTLYVICHAGSRSQKACEKLIAAGYQNVVSVEGGTQAWDQAGLPVIRGKKTISLERQVRIVAGALVFTGSALSFVNPYFALLSGFVGAGLVFAGITDTCGMGMMLAKMPWNQVKEPVAECATN